MYTHILFLQIASPSTCTAKQAGALSLLTSLCCCAVRRGRALDHSDTSAEEPQSDAPKRSKPVPMSPTKLSPKTGRMMEVGTGRKVQATASKAPGTVADADQPAEGRRADKEPAAKPPARQGPGRPPSKKTAGSSVALPHILIKVHSATVQ